MSLAPAVIKTLDLIAFTQCASPFDDGNGVCLDIQTDPGHTIVLAAGYLYDASRNTIAHVARCTDGINFLSVSIPITAIGSRITSIAYSSNPVRWLIYGYNGTRSVVATSDDGITWALWTPAAIGGLSSINPSKMIVPPGATTTRTIALDDISDGTNTTGLTYVSSNPVGFWASSFLGNSTDSVSKDLCYLPTGPHNVMAVGVNIQTMNVNLSADLGSNWDDAINVAGFGDFSYPMSCIHFVGDGTIDYVVIVALRQMMIVYPPYDNYTFIVNIPGFTDIAAVAFEHFSYLFVSTLGVPGLWYCNDPANDFPWFQAVLPSYSPIILDATAIPIIGPLYLAGQPNPSLVVPGIPSGQVCYID